MKSGLRVLGTVLEDRANSFNAVRLMAAMAVVVSHSFALVFGSNLAQPLAGWSYDLGANAVNVFFVLSGLMLSRSFERDPDWRSFVAARLLRIFPALLVAGMVVGWVIVPLWAATSPLDYFRDYHGLLYPFTSLFLFEDAHIHLGFPGSPFPGDLNLPLWTVKYELFAYAVFGLVSVAGLLRSKFVSAATCVLAGMMLLLTELLPGMDRSLVTSLARFGFCFLVGVTLYRFRDRIELRPVIAALAVVLAFPLGLTPLGSVAWVVALGYAAVTLAAVRIPVVTPFTNRWDPSFGIYIFGWPIQQVLMGLDGIRDSLPTHIALSMGVAAAVGWLSFVLVERPAMRQRKRLASWIWPRFATRRAAKQSREGT